MEVHIIGTNDSYHNSCRPMMDYYISNYIMKSDSEQVTVDSDLTETWSDQNISRTFSMKCT